MTGAYRDSTSVSSSGQVTTQAITIPADIQAGDYVLVAAGCLSATATADTLTATSTGTTPLPLENTQFISGPQLGNARVWEFTASATDAGKVITIGSLSGHSYFTGVALWAGDGFTGADVIAAPVISGTVPLASPPITTNWPGDWVICIAATTSVVTSFTATPYATLRQDASDRVAICDSNGSVGPALSAGGSGSWSWTGANTAGVAFTIALRATPVFPDAPLGVTAELLINGTWTDATPDMDHGPVSLGRGHPDESTTTSPSTLAVTFTNTTGTYSSKNPVSPLYPYLMRNVQCRASVPSQHPYLRLEADNADRAYVNETSTLDITGSIEMRIQLRPSDWRDCVLAAKWDGSPPSWMWQLNSDGTFGFLWSDSSGTAWGITSTTGVPQVNANTAWRVTMNVSNGTVTFYTASSIDGTYTQLGAAVSPTGGAATSIHSGSGGSAPLVVGYSFNVPSPQLSGGVDEYRLYNGIGGTVAADAVFTGLTAGTTSWTDSPGNTWHLAGGAEISQRSYRLHAEVPEWPQHQDPANKTITVAAEGGGLLRRIGQRNNPVNSSMYRAYTRLQSYSAPVAYWPMEDGAGASQLAGVIGGQPMFFSGSPQLAANSDFACSSPLPVVGGAAFSGTVPLGPAFTDNVFRFLMEVPAAGEPDGAQIAAVDTLGTIATFNLRYNTGGTLALVGHDSSGNTLFTLGPVAFAVNGQLLRVSIALQNAGGGSIEYSVQTIAPGASSGLASSGTTTGTIGPVTRVQLNQNGTLTQTVLGHASVQPVWDTLYDLDDYVTPAGESTGALAAWNGEPAAVRFARLCAEEGIQVRVRGNQNTTPAMGIQTAETITQLLQECADADRGVWTELRQALGFGYVCRNALYNQPAALTVDYDQDHLAMWTADPREDDQTTQNDITLTQANGGAIARQYAAPGQPVTGGRLSTLSPPNGMGTYDQSYSINLQQAADLNQLAGWMVHLGTVDQPRFPGIALDLANRDLASLFYQILALELGDRIVIDNLPAEYGPDPVSQLVQQVSEALWTKQLDIAIVGVPEQPYEVAQDGAGYHVDTDGTTLNAGVSSTATSMSFATAAGDPLWSVSTGDYPCDVFIAGERVTVTAVSGSSSPQAATVIRSVNGVVKAQASGAAVNVWLSPVAAL